MSPPHDPSHRVVPVCQLTHHPVAWLWPNRLPMGSVVLFEGDPGLGKSLVTLDLCARLSTGRSFPDDQPGPAPANAVVLNAEDRGEDTIRHRLQALGADLARVFVLEWVADPLETPLLLPAHTTALDRILTETRPQLLVIDPIMAFLDPTVQIASDPSVRRALRPLALLARKHGCVVLLVRHLNKSLGRRAMYRGGGSIGFAGACRSVWLFAPDPQTPTRYVMAQVKNNYAPLQPSLAYEMPAGEGAPLTLSWTGSSPLTADQLLAGGRSSSPSSASDLARDFLNSFLAGGPRTTRDIWPAAQQQGLSERTLQRVRKAQAIRSIRIFVEGRPLTYWLLPHQELPPTVPPDAAPLDLEPWLAPLREQFPPSTPLDEP